MGRWRMALNQPSLHEMNQANSQRKADRAEEKQLFTAAVHLLHYIETFFTRKPCHTKTGLKIFVIVIPKESLAGTRSAKPSFGMTLTIKYNL